MLRPPNRLAVYPTTRSEGRQSGRAADWHGHLPVHGHRGQHQGVVIKSRGEGDSFFAVFARATDALAAACALQQALLAEPWPPETLLRVRAALHTGEAQLRGED